MYIRIIFPSLVTILLILCSAAIPPVFAEDENHSHSDVVFKNGKILTLCQGLMEAEALAVKDGKIMHAGTSRELEPMIGPKTRVIDLEGRRVLPGFIESHAHLTSLGKAEQRLDATGTESAEEIARMVRERVAKRKPGEWILGRGWDQNDWEDTRFPTHEILTEAAPNNPVFLTRIDGHAGWANACAMEMAGVTKDTPDPDGGKIIRHEDGTPTGVFIDTAESLIQRKIPPMPASQVKEAMLAGLRKALSYGVTTMHDAGADEATISLYKEILAEGKLSPRMYVMLSNEAKLLEKYYASGPEIGLGDHRLTIRAIKMFADGALGSRGAAMLEPYEDDPGNWGLIIDDEDAIARVSCRALESGFQVCTHAIGDRANRITLNGYERGFKKNSDKTDHRFRIEHAQILDKTDLPRFKSLGVIPSMQPTHCTSDMPWAEVRINSRRAKEGAYAWRTLMDTGVVIPFGSDAPIESIDPLWGLYSAVTRQDHKGWPADGWYPDQRMTLMEAIESFTIHGAYAAFEEKIKGSLEKGKLADFVVLSQDILKLPPKGLLETSVVMTVVGGDIVYKK